MPATGIIWTAPPRAPRRRRGPAPPAATSPSSEERPRPSPDGRFFGEGIAHAASALLRQPRDQLAGQRHIGFRARAAMVVDQGRQAVARRLREADVARDHRVEHHLAEAGADVVGDLGGEVVAPVVHGERDAEDRELGIEAGADPLDRLEQLAEPFQREEFGLQRHQDRIGGDQGVDREQAERGRAIDQADVPAGVGRALQRLVEPMSSSL